MLKFNASHDGLQKAVEEFNETNLIATLYYNKTKDYFEVVAFANQVGRDTTVFQPNILILFEKSEFEENKVIGEEDLSEIVDKLNKYAK